ncbi:TonB-dependent receptor [Cystobacter fuscus]
MVVFPRRVPALGTSASVLAQPPEAPGGEPFRVPTVEVEEARPVSAPAESASRRDPSGALTVIDAEEGSGAARDTAALLSTAPGVVVQDSGGYGQSKAVVVRGASSNGTLVLLDGIPLNGAGGIADVSRVPVALAERIEVLRGGAGARYGSGGLGGVINIITRRPGETARVAGELSYGSWDTAVGWLSATGPIAGNEVLLLLHGGLSRGNFRYLFDPSPTLPGDALVESRRANNDAHGAGGLLRLRRELGGGFSVDALGELSLDGRGLAGTAQNPSVDARQSARRGSATVRLAGMLPGAGAWRRARTTGGTGWRSTEARGTGRRRRCSGWGAWRRRGGSGGGGTRCPRWSAWGARPCPPRRRPGPPAASPRGCARVSWRWTRCGRGTSA